MRRTFFLISIIVILTNLCYASLPDFKVYDSPKDLVKGDRKGVSITSKGELLLAPKMTKFFESDRPFIWDLEVDLSGNIYVSTGIGAKIFKISPNGKKNEIAAWQDFEVYALALDRNENLYASTSPDGKIYRIQANSNPLLVADLEVKYIWDIIFDQDMNAYVATGDSGAIYKINSTGEASLFFQSEETHIRCLTFDNQGNLIAGTHQNGLVIRIDQQGNGFVVYDTKFDEVFEVVVSSNNTIYAACMDQKGKSNSKNKSNGKNSDSKLKTHLSNIISISSHNEDKNIESGIVKIQSDGFVKNIWADNEGQVHSIYLNKEQDIIVGTGDDGQLYKISQDDELTILLNVPESQVVDFASKNTDQIYFCTSNLGTIYQLKKEFVKSGTYISPPLDTEAHSIWGMMHWNLKTQSEDDIRFFTRSGNTEKPDKTWHTWTRVDQNKNRGTIKSPRARFLQWKAKIESKHQSKSPVLSNIKMAYLQQNFAPEIVSFVIQPVESKRDKIKKKTSRQIYPGVAISVEDDLNDKTTGRIIQPPIQRRLTNGYRRIHWNAQDKNDDDLKFSLYFKQQDGADWWVLKEKISQKTYNWDTRKIPDGIYQLKLLASDAPSNPINTAKKASKLSDYFIVDNNGPVVEKIQTKIIDNDTLQLNFIVHDALSFIQEVQFSLNGTDWEVIYPTDLVCDAQKEEFDFKIELPEKRQFTLVIKATDEANNIGYGRTIEKN